MEDSVFTKIIRGEIPCHKVYEDDNSLAFLDIHPFQEGQVVVVPKAQVNFVWDLAEKDYLALMSAVHKVGQRLRAVFADKPRVGVRIEGLDVSNYAHVVVFPFSTSAEYHGHADMSAEPDHTKLAEMAERLRFSQ